jgi:hypothetical protein
MREANIRFVPKATRLLRSREMTQWAPHHQAAS